MADILKGNYRLANQPTLNSSEKKTDSDSLTSQLEESALAKLGGSICFVMKGTKFVWDGDEDAETGS